MQIGAIRSAIAPYGLVQPAIRPFIQPDGQITNFLSSPFRKNISLNPSGKSPLQARPILSRM